MLYEWEYNSFPSIIRKARAIKGEREASYLSGYFDVNKVFDNFIFNKYPKYKINAQDVWKVLNETPEFKKYIRTDLDEW